MYEMLTGRVPFDADTPVSVALKQVQEEPVDPITYNPNIPISVNRIILKAMQKDPNLRYQNATEMIADLKMALKRPDEDFVVLAYRDENSPTQKVPTIYEIEMAKNNERNAPKLSDKKEEPKKKSKITRFNEYMEQHKFLRFLFRLLIIAILIGIVSVFAMIVFKTTKVEEKLIPSVVFEEPEKMLTVDEAIEILTDEGFEEDNIKIVKENNSTVPSGKVFYQDPNPDDGIKYKVTQEITLKVSLGPKVVKVPDNFIGRQIEEVKSELKKLGFPDPEITEETNEDVEKGLILGVEPEGVEGEEVVQSTQFKFRVSSGSQFQDVEMKNVVGMGESEAIKLLEEELKLVVEVKYDEDLSKGDGIVLTQSEEEGKIVKEQSKVTLTINRWPEKNVAHFTINVASFYKNENTDTEDNSNSTTNTVVNSKDSKTTIIIKVDGNEELTDTSVSKTETNYTFTTSKYSGYKNVIVTVGGNNAYNESVDFSQEQTITISK